MIRFNLLDALATVSLLVLSNAAQLGQSPKVREMIHEYSDDIKNEKAMIERGLGRTSSLAISYSHRGKVYLLYADEPAKARDDFAAAIDAYRRAEKMASKSDNSIESGLAEAYLFRGRALAKLKQRDEALKSVTEAVARYDRLVQAQHEVFEPLLVYAMNTRHEMLTDESATPENLKQAIADADRAEPLLVKWSKKGQNDKFFGDELAALRLRRDELQKRASQTQSGAPGGSPALDGREAAGTPDTKPAPSPAGAGKGTGANAADRASRFEIITASATDSGEAIATAVSADGRVVVGTVKSGDVQQAFRWSGDEGLTMLGDFDGGPLKSVALNVSADGSVVVGQGTIEGRFGGAPRAFRWSANDGLQALGTHDGYDATEAVAVSADGSVIAGHLGTGDNPRARAFTWTRTKGFQLVDSTIQVASRKFKGNSTIVGISRNGQVAAGSMSMSEVDFNSACVWVDGAGAPIQPREFSEGIPKFMPAFVGTRSVVSDVWTDEEGVVAALIGRYQNKNRPGMRGFRIANKKFDWLEDHDGRLDWPAALSRNGERVVGAGRDAEGNKTASLWQSGSGVRSVATLLREAGVDVGEWTLTEATDISADGSVVVGTAGNAGAKVVAWRAVLR